MSAGEFSTSKYQCSADNGSYILACRVQPETLAATIDSVANDAPTGAVNAPGSATISQGRRSAGVNMRYVTLEWTGTKPTNYSGDTVRIPVLKPETFAAWTLGSTGTYLSQNVKVVGRNNETVK